MIKRLKAKKWFAGKTDDHIYDNLTCKNCETQFSGKYCPECGQSVKDYDKPLSFFFYNFAGDFFAFDIRFFKTLRDLVLKPGYLTNDFFNGRRVRHAPPLRIFVFVSFVLFLLLNIYTNRGLRAALDTPVQNFKADSTININVAQGDSAQLIKYAEIDSSGNLNVQLNLETFRDSEKIRTGLRLMEQNLQEQLNVEKDPETRAELIKFINISRNPEQAVAKILQYLSWAFFLLMPVFALILKLFYIRRNQNYMRHLVFSIHIHSFIFINFTILTTIYLLVSLNLEVVTSLFILCIPVYIVYALKRFYGQSWRKVLLKFAAITIIYNTILIFTIGFVILNAINMI